MKVGSRTVRKEDTKRNSQEFLNELYHDGKTYLIHRYEIRNDLYHWPKILGSNGVCFHMDYSENLSNTPKFAPQDTHFNKQ